MRNPSTFSSSPPVAAGGTSRSSSKVSKTVTACCSKVGMKKGPWTPEEDELLANYIKREGEGRWRTLPKRAGLLRCGKSCRLRWMNYLRPSVKRGHIAPDEEDLILRLHLLLGNRWSLIAGRIPGRTDNEIKNYWNTHLSKKLISQGIDPRTHKPLDPNTSSPDYQNKPSSSKPKNANSNPNPNYITSPSSEQETPGITGALIDDDQENGTVNLQNLDDTTKGLDNDDDDDINYCTDDVFSSFLNSLINEDVFDGQHQEPPNAEVADSSAVLISPAPSFAFAGAGWDAPIMSSTP